MYCNIIAFLKQDIISNDNPLDNLLYASSHFYLVAGSLTGLKDIDLTMHTQKFSGST